MAIATKQNGFDVKNWNDKYFNIDSEWKQISSNHLTNKIF